MTAHAAPGQVDRVARDVLVWAMARIDAGERWRVDVEIARLDKRLAEPAATPGVGEHA